MTLLTNGEKRGKNRKELVNQEWKEKISQFYADKYGECKYAWRKWWICARVTLYDRGNREELSRTCQSTPLPPATTRSRTSLIQVNIQALQTHSEKFVVLAVSVERMQGCSQPSWRRTKGYMDCNAYIFGYDFDRSDRIRRTQDGVGLYVQNLLLFIEILKLSNNVMAMSVTKSQHYGYRSHQELNVKSQDFRQPFIYV